MRQAIFTLVFLITMVGIATVLDESETLQYDCSIAEFQPNYPTVIKEECRRLKLEQKNI
jgi:hypothetical protein